MLGFQSNAFQGQGGGSVEEMSSGVQCKIGPIELDAAQLVDGDTNLRSQNLEQYLSPAGRRIMQGLRNKEEGFNVYCKKHEALDISGLAGWKELEWIDSSTSLINNDDIVHRGWGLLGKTKLITYPGVYSDVELEVGIVSPNENELLTMDYVKGNYSQLLVGYDEDAKEYLVQDTFDTFSNMIWTDPKSYRMTNPVVAASNGKLYLQGIKSSGGYGALFTILREVLPSSFTLKTGVDLSVSYTPASGSAVYLSTVITTQPTWDDFFSGSGSYSEWVDSIVISVGIHPSGGGKVYRLYIYQFDENGNEKLLISPFTTTAAEHDIQAEIKDNGNIDIYYDGVKKYSGPSGLSTVNEGLYAGYVLDISDTATPSEQYNMKATYMQVYVDRTFPQQVILPPYSKIFETPTAYRQTMWGDLPVFENPQSGVPFQTTREDYDKAGPRAWSNDNEKGELRRVFNQDEVIDLNEKNKSNEFYLENGIIKVEPTTDSVKLYAFESLLTDNQHDVRTNLTGLSGWGNKSQIEFVRDTSIFRTAGASARLKSLYNGLQNLYILINYSSKFAVIPGEEYSIPYTVAMVQTDEPKDLFESIHWFNSADELISAYTSPPVKADNMGWVEFPEFKVTPVAGAVKAYYRIYGGFQRNEILWYDSSQFGRWKLIEEIPIGNRESIRLIRIKEINRETITIQINRTFWTIRRGDPIVKVEHPHSDLGLSLVTCYYHDGTHTTNPKAGANITMNTQHYLLRWDAGPNLMGTYKWAHSVLANNGKIYGIPDRAQDILIVDPANETATRNKMGLTIPYTTTKDWWYGGVLANNGKIYGIPFDSDKILIIDPAAGTATMSTMGANLAGDAKWVGGVLANNGKIYGIPFDATDILIIDPAAGTATRSSMGATLTGSGKWGGGALANNGKIYAAPNMAADILIIDPAAGTATRSSMGLTLTGNNKYVGAVKDPVTHSIYCIPNNALKILKIDPGQGTALLMSGSDLAGNDKWSNAVVGSDNKIYCIPSSANDILIINPNTVTYTRSNMGCTNLLGTYKWFSGCSGSDGKIYGIPEDVDDFLLINPAAGTATRNKLNFGNCEDPLTPQQKRLMIVQTNPTTIKSDKIPATSETGIGIYDKDEAATGPSGYITLAGWFVNRGRQKIKLL